MRPNSENPNDRMIRIKSSDFDIFKEAYLELQQACRYAKANFPDTAIYPQLQKTLDEYTPRFKQITS